jgi:predicted SAM-dependent methyltransferase
MTRLQDLPRLNCGCWQNPLPGYVNLDMQTTALDCERGEEIMLLDVREGLPFGDGTVAEVRGDQFLEHLTLPELVAFLDECKRVLCVGGEVRFEFPDMVACAGGDIDARFVGEQGREVAGVPDELTMLNLLTYEWGHRCVLSLELVLPLFSQRFAVRHAARFGAAATVLGVKTDADAH